jgi:thymidylate kinase
MEILSQENKPYFLHIEGMDLAGKSTTAEKFVQASTLKWTINDKRLTQVNPIYDFAWGIGKKKICDSDTLGYLYLADLMEDLKAFQINGNIVQDSTLLLRSLNHYKTVGNNEKLVQAFTALVPKHPMPDKSFYITANIDVRRSRLEKRISQMPGKLTANDMLIKNNPVEFIKIDESLKELSVKYFNSKVIDTSYMTEQEVVECIKNFCPPEI